MSADRRHQKDTDNRRQYRRYRVKQPVRLEAILKGRYIDIMRLEMTGVTLDIGEGGLLAHVDQCVSPGVRCRIDFLEDRKREKVVETLSGRVRRAVADTRRGYKVAVEFDEPDRVQEILASLPGIEIEDDEAEAEAPRAVAAAGQAGRGAHL